MINVLVTCGGGFQGLTLFKALQNIDGLVLHLFDINYENISKHFFDYSTTSFPVGNEQKYIEQLLNYTIQHKIQFVFPATSYDLEVLSKLKQDFKTKHNCIVATPDYDHLIIYNNKIKSYKFLKENGFTTQDLIDVDKPFKFPVIGKPNVGWGSKGVVIVKESSDLKPINTQNYHFVEYFNPIEEFSIDFSINQFGECCSPIIRKRIVVSGGFSVVTETKPEYNILYSDVIQLVKKAFSKVSAIGIYNLQFVKNSNNEIYFTDLNSRIGTSCVLSNYLDQSIVSSFFNKEKAIISNVKSVRYLEEKFYPTIQVDNKIKAIVFDLDDTLISNKKFILSRCILLFNKLNIKGVSVEEFKINVLALLNEGKAPFLIDELIAIYNLPQDIKELIALYRTCYPSQIEVYDDVLSTLEYLKSKHYKLFLLTDNPKKSQKIKTKLIPEVISKFDSVFFTADWNSEKPNPLCFSKITEVTKLTPNQMVMVGDNEFRDVYGALNSGFAYAFHIIRKDGMVSQSIIKHRLLESNSFQMDSLQDLKFIL